MQVTEFDFLACVRKFMEIGGQSVDTFNAEQATLYTGLQLEEMSEKLEAISTGCVTIAARDYMLLHARAIKELAKEFKRGLHTGDVLRADREKLLDADIDLAWVSVGAAFSTANNTVEAAIEVGHANHQKFPHGVCTKDANGKIQKPADWRAPDLSRFVDKPSD